MIENEQVEESPTLENMEKRPLKHHDTGVILHLYYPEMWHEIRSYLSNLGKQFDLFVSIQNEADISEQIVLATFPHAQIYRFENRGRDIAPFLRIFSAISHLDYKYICKIHTKKSVHISHGKQWHQDMMDKLLGSPETVALIKQAFDEHPDWGLIAPHGHIVPHTYYWSQNAEKVLRLARSIGIPTDTVEFTYAAGSMFWFKPQALKLLLNEEILSQDFEPEQGQQDATFAHAFERLFGMVANFAGYKIAESDSSKIKLPDRFFHFDLLVQAFEKQVETVQMFMAQALKQGDTIQSLSKELSEKQQFIIQKEQIINQKEQIINQKEQQLTRNHQLIQSLTQQLAAIRSSTAWSIALRITRVGAFLFPRGSRRERLARLGIKALRTWRHEGLGVVFAKTSLKIKEVAKRYFVRPQPKTESLAVTKDTDDRYVPINELDVDPANVLVKTIAFYLPQFHPIPENNAWWGQGFTEWTNVSKAHPNFSGHYQPHLPGELGFYDLRVPEVQKRQVELAKKYGIYGFCFYYYWFSGKRLLERPLDQYLANPDLDLPFCLCWANENWTRRWDGAEHEVLIGQTHNDHEYLHFIQDISSNFEDPRYIRVNGKPVLIVYRIHLLPDPQKAARIWRDECIRLGIGDLYLIVAQSFGITDPRPYGFDAAVEFPPHGLNIGTLDQSKMPITNLQFTGKIYDYQQAAQSMINRPVPGYTLFKTVMPSWDNTARKQNAAHTFINASPAAYKDWLTQAVKYTKANLPVEKQLIFINAWNEWGEGTHLEPDRLYGYAYLQATADAISSSRGWSILFVSHDAFPSGSQRALLSTISWLKEHTNITLKILCLEGGELLPRFQALADTILLSELQDGESEFVKENVVKNLLKFCGGPPALIYGNSVGSGKAYQWLHELHAPILTHIYELEMSIQRYAVDWMGDVLKYSTHYITPSNAVKENLVKNHAVDPKKITVVYGAVSNEPIHLHQSPEEKQQGRAKLGLEAEKILIMGCGLGMAFRKGADLFIELGDLLRRQGRADFHLYWIGGFENSEHDPMHGRWADHKAKLAENDLGDFVTFLGYRENLKDHFQVADIFVLPSREDPLPLVAIEAAKYGLPLVCFAESGGTPELVGEDAGFVVPFEDVETMAEKVLRLMDDPALRTTLGNRAREKFLSKFTVERTTPNILSTCRKIAGQKPAVSIIVPNYNHSKYLPERLETIFNQTRKDFEVILLDDASTDNSMEVFQQYADYGDVRICKNDRNSGSPFRQWLVGLDMARADILWIAESDDRCKPEFLETLLPAFQDPAVKLAYANSEVIDENGRVVGDYTSDMMGYLTSLSSTKWRSSYTTSASQEINDALGIKNTILNASAVLLRKFDMSTDFKETLEKMRIAGDWYFYVHTIKDGKVHYDSRKLNSHRRHSNSVIAQMVSEKNITDFFREFSIVQKYIFSTYQMDAEFRKKWEAYLLQQLRDFSLDSSPELLKRYYPLDEMQALISKAQPVHNSSERIGA